MLKLRTGKATAGCSNALRTKTASNVFGMSSRLSLTGNARLERLLVSVSS